MHSISKHNTERPYLNAIFENGLDGFYTTNALLYQDILLYYFQKREIEYSKNITDTFVFNDLAGWLVMKKNIEITNYYSGEKAKTTKTSRINAMRRKVQKRIDDLKDMFILYELASVKARKNEEMTPLYCYSDYGKTLAWIVKVMGKSNTSNERKNANEKIYGLLQSYLPHTDSSGTSTELSRMSKQLFRYAFVEKCWKNGVFGEIVSTIIEVLHGHHKDEIMSTVTDRVIFDNVRFTSKRFRSKIWDSFIEALNSLDEATRKIVIHYEKLELERRIHESHEFQSDYKASRAWEDVWFENRSEYSKLVLRVFCNKCKYSGPGIADYYDFKREAFKLDDGSLVIRTDCPNCGDKGDILVSV